VNGKAEARRWRPRQRRGEAVAGLDQLGIDRISGGITRAAFGFAAARHAGQYREIDGVPFIVHPIEVGRLLQGEGQPDHVVAAGLLHDVLEKTATPALELELEFGTQIAQLVAAVSDDPSIRAYEDRKCELRDRVERSGPESLAIYAADKIAKVREMGLLSGWRASQRKNRAKLAHYCASLEMLRRAAGHSGLVMCLEAELGRLEPRAQGRRRDADDGAERAYGR
jgi:(p)ppGpp synthase/HD superfamily hydrolase